MKKHTLVHLLFTVALLSVCSCSSLKKFGEEKKFLYKTVLIDNTEKSYNNFDEVLYVNGNKESCFKDSSYGDIITVRSENLEAALNYFYRNKATWSIKETKVRYNRETVMKAFNEEKVQYEVSYCKFKYVLAFEEWHTYASFRLINPK
jgi:flagellar basal body L-ring protein FlgH